MRVLSIMWMGKELHLWKNCTNACGLLVANNSSWRLMTNVHIRPAWMSVGGSDDAANAFIRSSELFIKATLCSILIQVATGSNIFEIFHQIQFSQHFLWSTRCRLNQLNWIKYRTTCDDAIRTCFDKSSGLSSLFVSCLCPVFLPYFRFLYGLISQIWIQKFFEAWASKTWKNVRTFLCQTLLLQSVP